MHIHIICKISEYLLQNYLGTEGLQKPSVPAFLRNVLPCVDRCDSCTEKYGKNWLRHFGQKCRFLILMHKEIFKNRCFLGILTIARDG